MSLSPPFTLSLQWGHAVDHLQRTQNVAEKAFNYRKQVGFKNILLVVVIKPTQIRLFNLILCVTSVQTKKVDSIFLRKLLTPVQW